MVTDLNDHGDHDDLDDLEWSRARLAAINETGEEELKLSELGVGDVGEVVGFEAGSRGYRGRLMAMGLTPGTPFRLTRLAPLGDPVEIHVRGFALSLRKDEAEAVRVERR